ncbi:MAG: dimethylsulfoniopropionate demethylase [Sneathiella sp.]|uniref:dimethylsulfoniopropionate demethylase n=1 Tax=Sneathiella sp. TaxID=1964365 RepID=UPI003002CBEE
MATHITTSKRLRSTPFTSRVEACGVKDYTVYNHMLLPTVFRSLEEDYQHLCEHVQVWDVSCERQVEIAGPDAQKLVQKMTPRDLSKAKTGMCFYVPLCDETGGMINDPIAIKHNDDLWWLSIADTDVILWAKGLAAGLGLNVQISEPDVWPLGIQGPKAEELTARIFGSDVHDIRFFRYKMLSFKGTDMLVARSGWSKQGGFEIYVNDAALGRDLWDELFRVGEDLNVGPGCPNQIERMESGLLSFGSDMGFETTPFEVGLDQYVSLDADIDSLSINALRTRYSKKKLVGIVVNQPIDFLDNFIYQDESVIGEITSLVWSPRYQSQLAFALCDLSAISSQTHVHVLSSEGLKQARVAKLPFDFEALGLKG